MTDKIDLKQTLKRLTEVEKRKFFKSLKFVQVTSNIRHKQLELKALITGSAFKCAALCGESHYNIAINPDLTVSCNYNDTIADGRIGDMSKDTLVDIFNGDKAMSFRSTLASGKLPTSQCAKCADLICCSKEEAKESTTTFSLPTKGILLETNGGCNLSCIGCGRALRPLGKKQMALEHVENITLQLKDMGVQQIFLFNLGEPFLSKNILQEVKAIKRIHPDAIIGLSTNCLLLNTDEKREAAFLCDWIHVSLDGCSQETASKFQAGTNFETAFLNMENLVKYCRDKGEVRPDIIWKYVVFNWNDRSEFITKALSMAKDIQVDSIMFAPSRTPYFGTSLRFKLSMHFRVLAKNSLGWRVLRIDQNKKQHLT